MKKYSHNFIKINKENTAILLTALFLLSDIGGIGALYYGIKNNNNKIAYASQITPIPLSQNPSIPSIFRDDKKGISIAIQLESNLADTGQFDLFIPDKGYYKGDVELHSSDNKFNIRNSLPGFKIFQSNMSIEEILKSQKDTDYKSISSSKGKIIFIFGQINAQYYPITGQNPAPAKLFIIGVINQTKNTATIHTWIDKTHYHLKSSLPDTQKAKQTAQQTADAITLHDWPALYNLLSSDIKSNLTLQQFTNEMTNPALPEIINVALDGEAKTETVSGNTYYAQPINLSVVEDNGTQSIYKANSYFVLEGDTWRFLTTGTPVEQ